MGFLDKFLNKFTNKASEKLADKAVNKIFGSSNNTQNDIKAEETVQTAQNVESVKNTVQQGQTIKVEKVQVPVFDANQMAMMGQGMAQANEIMKYLILDDNMEVVGVKDDAPDYLKIAYKNGKLNNKD